MKLTQGLRYTIELVENNEGCDTEGLTEIVEFCKTNIEQFNENNSNCNSFINKNIKFRGQVGEAHFSFVCKAIDGVWAVDRIDAEIFTLGLEKGTSNYAYKVTIASKDSATSDLRRTKKYLVSSTRTTTKYHQRPENTIRKYVIESTGNTNSTNSYSDLSLISVYNEGTTIRRLRGTVATNDNSFNGFDDIAFSDVNI